MKQVKYLVQFCKNWILTRYNKFRQSLLLYRLLTFSKEEAITIKLALASKKKRSVLWLGNNLIVPLMIMITLILT